MSYSSIKTGCRYNEQTQLIDIAIGELVISLNISFLELEFGLKLLIADASVADDAKTRLVTKTDQAHKISLMYNLCTTARGNHTFSIRFACDFAGRVKECIVAKET